MADATAYILKGCEFPTAAENANLTVEGAERIIGRARSALAPQLLAEQLASESANSVFTAEGALSDDAIQNSTKIQIEE